jgi:TPR repeat protein
VRAAHWFRKAAEQGHIESQYKLGRYYVTGTGVKRSYRKAMEWFLLAAEQGDVSSQRLLAAAYFEGRGLPRDTMESRMWLEISGAADQLRGRKLRDELDERMSEDQVARARARAEAWRAAYDEAQPKELQSSR